MSQATHEGHIPQLTLGWRLRMARETTGMGLREFADHIGVAPDTCTAAEKDKRKARKITVLAYVAATGVDRHWLETGEEAASSPDPGDGQRAERVRKLTEQKKARASRLNTPKREYGVSAAAA